MLVACSMVYSFIYIGHVFVTSGSHKNKPVAYLKVCELGPGPLVSALTGVCGIVYRGERGYARGVETPKRHR